MVQIAQPAQGRAPRFMVRRHCRWGNARPFTRDGRVEGRGPGEGDQMGKSLGSARGRRAVLAVIVALAALAVPASALGAKPSFGPDLVLPGGQGGEPSIAIDTSRTASRNFEYVVAIGDPNGPLEWPSYNGGKSWAGPVPFDTSGPARGGDSDVAVNTNGDVL